MRSILGSHQYRKWNLAACTAFPDRQTQLQLENRFRPAYRRSEDTGETSSTITTDALVVRSLSRHFRYIATEISDSRG